MAVSTTELEQKLGEILAPTYFIVNEDGSRFNESASKAINKLISEEVVKELQEIADHNYADDLGTYDYDGIATEVLYRVKTPRIRKLRGEKW